MYFLKRVCSQHKNDSEQKYNPELNSKFMKTENLQTCTFHFKYHKHYFWNVFPLKMSSNQNGKCSFKHRNLYYSGKFLILLYCLYWHIKDERSTSFSVRIFAFSPIFVVIPFSQLTFIQIKWTIVWVYYVVILYIQFVYFPKKYLMWMLLWLHNSNKLASEWIWSTAITMLIADLCMCRIISFTCMRFYRIMLPRNGILLFNSLQCTITW